MGPVRAPPGPSASGPVRQPLAASGRRSLVQAVAHVAAIVVPHRPDRRCRPRVPRLRSAGWRGAPACRPVGLRSPPPTRTSARAGRNSRTRRMASAPRARIRLSGSSPAGRVRNRRLLPGRSKRQRPFGGAGRGAPAGIVAVEAEIGLVGQLSTARRAGLRSGRCRAAPPRRQSRRHGARSRPCSPRPRSLAGPRGGRGAARSRQYRLAPLWKRGVSGELRYFGSPVPMTRPPKAMTRPRRSLMGNMTRPRKRS